MGGSGRADFARQLAERNQAADKQKKFRTSAPKGSKLAQGYVDRAKTREDEEADERSARLKALEEALKKEEIDPATYEKLRFQIAGGDLSSTHLVKGLGVFFGASLVLRVFGFGIFESSLLSGPLRCCWLRVLQLLCWNLTSWVHGDTSGVGNWVGVGRVRM